MHTAKTSLNRPPPQIVYSPISISLYVHLGPKPMPILFILYHCNDNLQLHKLTTSGNGPFIVGAMVIIYICSLYAYTAKRL